jgi:hypothetical protein
MSNFLGNKTLWRNGLFIAIALAFALMLHGAVPFYLAPTLGQAVWTTGFAQSFLNDSLFSIYAYNIGAPEPAAIAFGLPGAWLTALYLKMGLLAPDAYAAMIATWMSASFFAAYGMARHFAASSLAATMAAFCWLTMPMTWAHASYSMLSTGIGLLPLYFLFTVKIFSEKTSGGPKSASAHRLWYFLYPAVCVISLFMDGYSFVMFAVGASILALWLLLTNKDKQRTKQRLSAFSLHFISLGFACLLYLNYVGSSGFAPSPIDFFRGWGADLMFILVPTKGMHWIPDIAGWSVHRSGNRFFGDASVWKTSFSIGLIIPAAWAAIRLVRKEKMAVGLLLVAFVGFYMSLGPSFKFNSVKPEDVQIGPMMPEEYAIAPTGTAILSKSIPGFKSMRASYRWGALGVFGAWGLLVLSVSGVKEKITVPGAIFLLIAVPLIHLPNLPEKVKQDITHRKMFLQLEDEWIGVLRQDLHQGERVVFLPWRNDFLVNYAASAIDVEAFNIGGDKNFAEARKHWPKTLQNFSMGLVDPGFSQRVRQVLSEQIADVVVLPFIDLLWAAHRWPYPVQFKEQLAPVIAQLKFAGGVQIKERETYATVRLSP